MNKITRNTVLVLVGLFLGLLFIVFLLDKNSAAGFAMIGVFCSLLLLAIGFLFFLFKNSRDIGAGFMLSALLIGIIGFGVCTANFRMNPTRGGSVSNITHSPNQTLDFNNLSQEHSHLPVNIIFLD